MRRSKPLIGVIVKDSDTILAIQQFLDREVIEIKIFETLTDFRRSCGNDPYAGFIVDLRFIFGATHEEKSIVAELEHNFPFLRVVRNKATNRVTGIVGDTNLVAEEIFPYFIKEKVALYRPRCIRTSSRIQTFLAVSIRNEQAGNNILTCSFNVSKGGMFLFSGTPLEIGDTLNVYLNALKDQTPIECRVRWTLPWGRSLKHPPGAGVEFINIKPQQLENLLELLGDKISQIQVASSSL